MGTKVGNDAEAPKRLDERTEPLLIPAAGGGQGKNTTTTTMSAHPVVHQAFKNAANLANLLPTGTVLAFQLLSPVVTNMGTCDVVFKTCTAIFMAVCGLSCVVLTFTDSFVDEEGRVRYVLPTFRGLWVIDGAAPPPPEVAAEYRLRFLDFAHAFMTLSIFAAVAALDSRVLSCLYPTASSHATLALKLVPLCFAVFCSSLLVVFPTRRHGIGFPISPH